jgi:polyisoprenyl-teichoic acid--peptidoglycan teichoic acid transferase
LIFYAVGSVKQLNKEVKAQKVNASGNKIEPNGLPLSTVSPRFKPQWMQLLFWASTGLLTAVTALSVGTAVALLTPFPGTVAPKAGQKLFSDLWRSGFQYTVARPVNILVMGVDRVPNTAPGSTASFDGRSDTLLLVRVDPSDRTVSLLSIPRDTQVEIPTIGTTKVNHANAIGGPALVRTALSDTLNGIKIDRYVRMSTEAFRELVDQLGGVEVDVPEAMEYTDKTQNLKIDLKPGLQTLNGDQAEQFARFRQDGFGDIGRVQRQQALLKALRSRLSRPLMIARVPGLVHTMQKYIDTNLSNEELLALVNFGLKLDQKDLKMVMLPGRFSAPREFIASYWILDPAGRDRVLTDFFDLNKTDLSAEPVGTSLRIAVQNASGQPLAGKQFSQSLKQLGYDNLYAVEDWSSQQQQTQIIAQKGDLQAAKTLQSVLGIGNVEAASTGDLESDITIRIGTDWANKQPQ